MVDEITVRTANPLSPPISPPTPPNEPDADLTYGSKLPPDHPGLRLDKPTSRFLKKGPALALVAGLTVTVGVAVAFAVTPKMEGPDRAATSTLPQGEGYKNFTVAAVVQAAPGNDSPLRPSPPIEPKVPLLGPPAYGVSATNGSAHLNGTPEERDPQREARREAVREEDRRALGSPILAALDEPIQPDPSPRATARDPVSGSAQFADSPLTVGMPSSTQPVEHAGATATDQNMQQRKNDFLKRDGVSDSDYLSEAATAPRSPYEVKAGTIIPTTLLTGINSDLPGQIIGQVRENVYDSVNGEHLLIPQGSRLLASYDSMVGFGQDRILVCWNRLIRPDGISLRLQCMPGADLAGYAGFADEVDHHWWRILSGVAMGSLLAATAQRSQGDVSGLQPTFPQIWASNAAAGINQAGQQITQKNLQIQPTITIRPGFSVNVIVSKDMVLPPLRR